MYLFAPPCISQGNSFSFWRHGINIQKETQSSVGCPPRLGQSKTDYRVCDLRRLARNKRFIALAELEGGALWQRSCDPESWGISDKSRPIEKSLSARVVHGNLAVKCCDMICDLDLLDCVVKTDRSIATDNDVAVQFPL